MKTIRVNVDVPEGYLLAPFPKSFLNQYERITLKMPEDMNFVPDIDVVLIILSDSDAIIEWKILHSGQKGCNHYLLGIQNDKFYIEPNHNKEKFERVSIQGKDVRLYYPIRNSK